MKIIAALRARRAEIAKGMRSMLETYPGALWTPEIQAKWDGETDEINRIDGEITRQQKIVDMEAEAEFADMPRLSQTPPSNANREIPGGAPDGRALLSKWLRGGDKGLSAEEWTSIRNTMSTTTSAQGGYTVPTEVAKEIIDSMKFFGGMRMVSTIIQTADGAPMNFPTSDGTSEVGEILAENAAAAAADPSFGVVALTTYKYSSKVVAAPLELLMDAAVDIEAFIAKRLAQRLGRITNTHYTVGTGSSQPNGVVTAGTLGKTGTNGQTGSVIYDDLVDLIHSVDPAYRAGKCNWMMNDASVKVVRKLKDGQSRPLWIPQYDSGIQAGVPDTLLGYPVITNQDVATMAASAKSILFGDFSKYIIRDVLQFVLRRFDDSAYAKNGQVGFLAFMRTTGNLTDAAAVKYYANSAT